MTETVAATTDTTSSTSKTTNAATAESALAERQKDCPLQSLTAIDSLVAVTAAANTLRQVEPPIGGSVVASVRVDRVFWQNPNVNININVGDVFDGLVYAHSTTAADWGFDEQWLSGNSSLVTGLATNQIREVAVPWEFESVLVHDASLAFPVPCFTARFQELARRTNRTADLALYVDLLTGVEPVQEAANAIDDELPGE